VPSRRLRAGCVAERPRKRRRYGAAVVDVDVLVLGPLRVAGVPAPTARQQRVVFAALAASAPRPVPAVRLIDGLWGDAAPADRTKALQVVVARLRKAMAPSGVDVVLDDGGYTLTVAPERIDAAAFRCACEGEAGLPEGDLEARRALLESALSLCDAEPFGELADEPLLADTARELRMLWDDAVGRLHDVRLAQGQGARLVPELATWAERRPLDEAAWCRLALGLHQAGRVTEAMRTLHRHRQTVRETAGLEATAAVAELEARLLAGEPMTDVTEPVGNLRVPGSSFLGRSADLRAVTGRVRPGRIVTIVGTGGVGKTTLALHAAAAVRARYCDGLWFCELADIESPDGVVAAVASTLGVRRQRGLTLLESIVKGFGSSSALVVLDNCEHVLDAAGAVASGLATSCPRMAILATSRAPMSVSGEVVHPLGPLDVPASGAAGHGPAVELFIDRARAAGASVGSDPPTTADVVDICRRLDGLPLAIELAAARARTMGLPEIRIRLDERFRILGRPDGDPGDRHRTLWDALDWSYRLLEPPEQELFSTLSVFLGGFTAPSAAAVAGRPVVEVEESIWALADRSMLALAAGGPPTRYQLLETLRQYGHEQLLHAGRLEAVREAHLGHFVELVSESRAGLRTSAETTLVPLLTAELPNLRAAHQYAIERSRASEAALLVAALHEYAEWRQFFELGSWAEVTLVLPGVPLTEVPALRAIAGWGRCIGADFATAIEHAEAGLAAEPAGGESGWLHDVLAHCAYFSGDADLGLLHGEAEVARARADGDAYRLAYVLADRGTHASLSGHPEIAAAHTAEALRLAESTGCPSVLSMAQMAQGFLHRYRDEPVQAIEWLHRAAELADTVDSRWTSGICRGELAVLLALHGDPAEALTLGLEQFGRFRRAGDDGRTRGVVRMVIPALHRLLGQDRWPDLVTLHAGTRGRPMIEEPHNDRAVDEVVARIAGELGTAVVADALARGSAMADRAVFDLAQAAMGAACPPGGSTTVGGG